MTGTSSNVALVLRRLRRIARHHGADPVFVCCSATIRNPGELAGALIGGDVEVVDDDEELSVEPEKRPVSIT